MDPRLVNTLQHIEGRFSIDHRELRNALHGPIADSLIAGLMNHGLLVHDKRQDRYAVNEAGRRCLDHLNSNPCEQVNSSQEAQIRSGQDPR